MTRRGLTWQERLFAKVNKTDTCWIWTGAISHNRYGLFVGEDGQRLPKMTVVHRWAYYALVGPIPEGMTLDHLCYVRACVNPAHLEPVTIEENLRRAVARRTHCRNGHERTDSNTSIGSDGYRRCMDCERVIRAARRAERVAA